MRRPLINAQTSYRHVWPTDKSLETQHQFETSPREPPQTSASIARSALSQPLRPCSRTSTRARPLRGYAREPLRPCTSTSLLAPRSRTSAPSARTPLRTPLCASAPDGRRATPGTRPARTGQGWLPWGTSRFFGSCLKVSREGKSPFSQTNDSPPYRGRLWRRHSLHEYHFKLFSLQNGSV